MFDKSKSFGLFFFVWLVLFLFLFPDVLVNENFAMSLRYRKQPMIMTKRVYLWGLLFLTSSWKGC